MVWSVFWGPFFGDRFFAGTLPCSVGFVFFGTGALSCSVALVLSFRGALPCSVALVFCVGNVSPDYSHAAWRSFFVSPDYSHAAWRSFLSPSLFLLFSRPLLSSFPLCSLLLSSRPLLLVPLSSLNSPLSFRLASFLFSSHPLLFSSLLLASLFPHPLTPIRICGVYI